MCKKECSLCKDEGTHGMLFLGNTYPLCLTHWELFMQGKIHPEKIVTGSEAK